LFKDVNTGHDDAPRRPSFVLAKVHIKGAEEQRPLLVRGMKVTFL
jgi:hypothetical protein